MPTCCCALPYTHHLHQHSHLTPTFCPPVFLVRDCVRAHVRLAHINLKSHWTETHSSVCSTQILLAPYFYIKFLNHLLCSSYIFHDLKFMYVCMCDTTHMWRSEVSLHRVNPRNGTRVIRLGCQCLYWLYHLGSPSAVTVSRLCGH